VPGGNKAIWIHKPWKAPAEIRETIHYSRPTVDHAEARDRSGGIPLHQNPLTRDYESLIESSRNPNEYVQSVDWSAKKEPVWQKKQFL
jgi:hypothetical protein